jgi:hypothetical protein
VMRVLSQVRFQFMDAPQQRRGATSLTMPLGCEASQACLERINLLWLWLNGQLRLGGLRHRADEGGSSERSRKRISAPESASVRQGLAGNESKSARAIAWVAIQLRDNVGKKARSKQEPEPVAGGWRESNLSFTAV